MLGLYFYRARHAVLTANADLRDASCRPDPDFAALTLGLCRPGLRAKVARLSRGAEPIDLLFYSIGSKKDILLLVGLLRLETVFPDHASARIMFTGKLPPNLIVPGNPCRFGTEVEPSTGRIAVKSLPRFCACHRYVLRAATSYLQFAAKAGAARITSPVPLSLKELAVLSPLAIGSRWPARIDPGLFQKATQNGAHWIREPSEIEAIRRFFLEGAVTRSVEAMTSDHLEPPGSIVKGRTCGPSRRTRGCRPTRGCT
jgi:hypothetical protein